VRISKLAFVPALAVFLGCGSNRAVFPWHSESSLLEVGTPRNAIKGITKDSINFTISSLPIHGAYGEAKIHLDSWSGLVDEYIWRPQSNGGTSVTNTADTVRGYFESIYHSGISAVEKGIYRTKWVWDSDLSKVVLVLELDSMRKRFSVWSAAYPR
jgi:hypothetical protein